MRNEEDSELRKFSHEIEVKQLRKIKARRGIKRSTWSWLGMFGLVGWAVMLPTLIFLALGIWIDKTFPSQVSWTLTLLITGIIVGCFNAWYWIKRESKGD